MKNAQPRIFVAGHRGLVGSAIVRVLHALGQGNLVTRTHAELELTDQAQVRAFFEGEHQFHGVAALAMLARWFEELGS